MGFHLPFFPWYAAETIADGRIQAWTLDEYAAWHKLLCHNWNDLDIPASVTELARLLRIDTQEMVRIWSVIGDRFTPVPDKPGRLWSPRLEEERDKALRLSKVRSGAGKKGATARWNKEKKPDGKRIRLPMRSQCDGSADALRSQCPLPSPPQPPPQPPSPASHRGPAGEVNGSALVLFRSALAERLGLPRMLDVGRNPEAVIAFFEAQLAAVGEQSLLADCEAAAARSTSGTPSTLSWFVGWLNRLPVPKEAMQ